MKPSVRQAGLAGAVWSALLILAAPSWAQPPGSIPPVYAERLRVPVRGDDLTLPRAVVADPHTGEIFVCDGLRNRVVIFDPQGRFRYQIPGGSAFQSPVDLAVDREGYLFVLSQVSSEITLLDFDGRLIQKIALTGLPEGAGSPRFVSLAISNEADRLFVVDTENNRVWITDREGSIQDSVDMTVGRSQEEIDQLRYGHLDIYGDTVLLAVPSDGLVHLYDLAGESTGTIGNPGSAKCQTAFPAAAALDDQGRVIILDQQRALFMTWDLARGICLSEHYGFGNAPGALYQPSDLALDGAGRLYVSQGFEGRVQVYEGARPASFRLAVRQPSSEAFDSPAVSGSETPEEKAEEGGVAVLGPESQPTERESSTLEEQAVATKSAPEPAAPIAKPALEDASIVATSGARSAEFASLLVAGARQEVARAPRYESTYVELVYPGGDLPRDRGATTDLVVRAFRHAGIDLQKAVHEDVLEAREAYGINEPDPSIDHRRIRNLVTFFERKAGSLPLEPDADWAAGDLVAWDRDSDGTAGHLGVVMAELGPSGKPLVVHHHQPDSEFSGTPGADDVLVRWPVVGHYRWSSSE